MRFYMKKNGTIFRFRFFSLSLFFGLANAEELGSKDPYGDINSPESIIDFLVNEAHVIPNPHHFEPMATITATSRAGVSGAIGQVRGTRQQE